MEEIWIVECITEEYGSEFSYFSTDDLAEAFVADCKADATVVSDGRKASYEITSEPVDL